MVKRAWHTYFNVVLFLVMIGGVTILSAACGTNKEAQREWVYIPEFISIGRENISFDEDVQVSGDCVYFLSDTICKYSVADGEYTSLLLHWQNGKTDRTIKEFFVADDGSIYLIADEDTNRKILYKFDDQGNQIFFHDVTEKMGGAFTRIAADSMGRLYLGSGTKVWLYDETGSEHGYISLENTGTGIIRLGCDRKGDIFAVYYENGNHQGFFDLGSPSLSKIDYDNRTVSPACSDYPMGKSNDLIPGMEEDFLAFDSLGVYEYDLSTQTKKWLFNWLECDIDGSFVSSIGVLGDGRIVVFYENRLNGEREIAILTKTEKEQIAQKETIVVATMYYNSPLQAAAIEFNRNSDKYKVVIKQYIENGSSGTDALQDAIVSLNSDLVSAACPDIIDLSELNIDQLVAAGVLEDMTPYLENSGGLSREDFMENILDEYTIEGSLVTIPCKFTIHTVVGSSAKIGEKSGWTLDEIIEFADTYPGSELFGNIEKREILQFLMMSDMDTFINWHTGECKFDSGQFKNLLQFVDGLSDVLEENTAVFSGPAIDVDEQDRSIPPNPVRIQNGEVLLDIEYIYNFDTIQMCKEIFQGDVVCIGFPTLDGTGGHIVYPLQAYGITAKSNHKEGAWEFIESLLLQDEDGLGNEYGFPTRKAGLEAMVRRTLYFGYLLDENGELLLDGEGKPMEDPEQIPVTGYKDGWSYVYRRTTQEEIDMILAVLEDAKRVSGSNDEIMNIISEEVDGFFVHQKSVDDVADVIQSRVGIYLEENR